MAKFISNSKNVLKELLPYGVSEKHSIVGLDLQNTPTQRALGVLWDTENNLLKVIEIQKDIPMTKRGLLRQIIQLLYQRKIN